MPTCQSFHTLVWTWYVGKYGTTERFAHGTVLNFLGTLTNFVLLCTFNKKSVVYVAFEGVMQKEQLRQDKDGNLRKKVHPKDPFLQYHKISFLSQDLNTGGVVGSLLFSLLC